MLYGPTDRGVNYIPGLSALAAARSWLWARDRLDRAWPTISASISRRTGFVVYALRVRRPARPSD